MNTSDLQPLKLPMLLLILATALLLFERQLQPDPMTKQLILAAAVAVFSLYASCLGFRLTGKPHGVDPAYDEIHDAYLRRLRWLGPLVMALLMMAAIIRLSHLNVVEGHVNRGELIKAVDQRGDPEAARKLGLDYELIAACIRGDVVTVARLARQGVPDGDRPGFPAANRNCHVTALHHAASRGHVEVVRTLLDHGAYVDVQERDGITPIMCAAHAAHWDVVRLLAARGADGSMKDALGVSAADDAERYGEHLLAIQLRSRPPADEDEGA
jgi:hypothetical protein